MLLQFKKRSINAHVDNPCSVTLDVGEYDLFFLISEISMILSTLWFLTSSGIMSLTTTYMLCKASGKHDKNISSVPFSNGIPVGR